MTAAIDYGHIEPVQVHFDDLDAMGMLHNVRYGLLVERAITAYWIERGWAFDPAKSRFPEVFFAVREFTITYHAPIVGAGEVAVHFWLEQIGRTSAVYGFSVLSADRKTVHAEGRRVQVNIDRKTFRPTPFGAELNGTAAVLLRPAPVH